MVAARIIKIRTKIGMSQSRISILALQVPKFTLPCGRQMGHTALHKIISARN
jgi:hypothetical protein